MEKLTILYGTQTGNAERLALRVSRIALQHGVTSVVCCPADDVPISKWPRMDGPVLLLCSNANQGEAPNTFRRTWVSLLQPDSAPPGCMTGLRYAVFGLGDSLYLKFNYMAKMVHNRLRQLGGEPILLRGLGDESDAKGIEEALQPWLTQLWSALELEKKKPASMTAAGNSTRAPYPQEDLPYFPLYSMKSVPASADSKDYTITSLRFSEPVFECEVVHNKRLTAPSCAQAAHHLELRVVCNDEITPAAPSIAATVTVMDQVLPPTSVVSTSYEVGDALGIYSPNRAELVEELLLRLQRDGDEMVILTPDASSGLTCQPPRPFFHRAMPLRTLLQHYVDLDAVVTQEFMWMLAHEVPGPEEDEDAHDFRERLYELGNPSNVNDYLQYAHREKRNVCEVLHDFKDLHPPLELVLSFLTPMLPRYFSIASAPALDGADRFDLCVALLDWHTPLKRHRTGLCSSHLVKAGAGTRLTCFVWQGSLTLPAVPSPLLCVATGTGIAPIRAVLRQVAGLSAHGWKEVPVVLVFGCRHEAEDFLYREEWTQLQSSGAFPMLKVIPAFSRDTARKIYVQHKLGEHAKLISAFLQPEKEEGNEGSGTAQATAPGVMYVCGNAKQMPKDVQRGTEQIVEATVAGVVDEAAAAAYVRALTRGGRYQVDSWSA